MRTLYLNKRPFWFAQYDSKKPILTAGGLPTGEEEIVYKTPEKAFGNISASAGNAAAQIFGRLEDYTHLLLLEGTNWPIDEHTLFWLDSTPLAAHDAIVRRIAKSINLTAVALKRVTVSG